MITGTFDYGHADGSANQIAGRNRHSMLTKSYETQSRDRSDDSLPDVANISREDGRPSVNAYDTVDLGGTPLKPRDLIDRASNKRALGQTVGDVGKYTRNKLEKLAGPHNTTGSGQMEK